VYLVHYVYQAWSSDSIALVCAQGWSRHGTEQRMARPSSPATPSLQTAINYINQSKPKHLCLWLLCGCVAFWVLFCFDRLERLRTMPKKHTRCPSATCPYSPWKSAEKFHPWQIQSESHTWPRSECNKLEKSKADQRPGTKPAWHKNTTIIRQYQTHVTSNQNAFILSQLASHRMPQHSVPLFLQFFKSIGALR
jgi:hypothetical protein